MYCAELEQYIVGVINADDAVDRDQHLVAKESYSEANEMIRDDDGQAQLRQAMLACFKKDDFNQTQQHKGVDVAVKLTWI